MPVRPSAPIALRYSASIRAWAHTKLIRQIVLTVTGTELKSSNAASFVMSAAANQRQAPSSHRLGAVHDPNSAGCKRHDGQTSDSGYARPSHRSRRGSDELEDPCPLPARKLARNAQHG